MIAENTGHMYWDGPHFDLEQEYHLASANEPRGNDGRAWLIGNVPRLNHRGLVSEFTSPVEILEDYSSEGTNDA